MQLVLDGLNLCRPESRGPQLYQEEKNCWVVLDIGSLLDLVGC